MSGMSDDERDDVRAAIEETRRRLEQQEERAAPSGRGERPEPGLDGTYRDSCVLCLEGTDTAVAFVGESEWAIAGMVVLGVDQAAAIMMVEQATGAPPGQAPVDDTRVQVRCCRSCLQASETGMTVAPVSAGFRSTGSGPR